MFDLVDHGDIKQNISFTDIQICQFSVFLILVTIATWNMAILRDPLPSPLHNSGIRHEYYRFIINVDVIAIAITKLRGFGPLANYADQTTAASWRSDTNFCG
jgi:hypothetical protein